VGAIFHHHFPILALLILAVAQYGLFVRQHLDSGRSSCDAAFVIVTSLFWSALLVIVGFAWSPHWGLGEIWLGKVAAFAVGAIVFLIVVLRRRLSGDLLSAIGRVSYPMFFFLPLALTAAQLVIGPVGLTARGAAALGALGAAFAAAEITVRLVGSPTASLGRRLVANFEPERSAPRPPVR
jgi:peptidoglycan/LPS O-acetylase OafA/YrhL